VTFAIFCVVDGDPCPFQPTQKGTDYLLAPRRKTSSFFILPFALPLEFEFFLLLCVPLRETHPIFANPGFRQIHRAQLEKSITRLIACSPRPRPSSGRWLTAQIAETYARTRIIELDSLPGESNRL
jgi:hypothetical protein